MSDQEPVSQQFIIQFPSRPEYEFSNFIVSEGSRFALKCAQDICSDNPATYQTLYISGAEGLGKTHLLMAIGNHLASRGTLALYIHCRELMESLGQEEKSVDQRLEEHAARADFLLLDDIDRISGHSVAQEALYRIYNQIKERGGRMVFAGRTPASGLEATESFITSRFKWGMTAEILPMDDESSSQLFHKLADDLSLEIPDKVIDFLLARIPRDFQSIQQAVTRINQESLRQKHRVTLPLVKTALNL